MEASSNIEGQPLDNQNPFTRTDFVKQSIDLLNISANEILNLRKKTFDTAKALSFVEQVISDEGLWSRLNKLASFKGSRLDEDVQRIHNNQTVTPKDLGALQIVAGYVLSYDIIATAHQVLTSMGEAEHHIKPYGIDREINFAELGLAFGACVILPICRTHGKAEVIQMIEFVEKQKISMRDNVIPNLSGWKLPNDNFRNEAIKNAQMVFCRCIGEMEKLVRMLNVTLVGEGAEGELLPRIPTREEHIKIAQTILERNNTGKLFRGNPAKDLKLAKSLSGLLYHNFYVPLTSPGLSASVTPIRPLLADIAECYRHYKVLRNTPGKAAISSLVRLAESAIRELNKP